MASGDEEKLVATVALGHEEAACARRVRCSLGSNGEAERVSQRVANFYSWIGGEDGRERLGTGRPGNGRIADFDVDVIDAECLENFETPESRVIGVFAGQSFGVHPDPEDDGGVRLPHLADANDVDAGPLDPHLIQASDDLESYVVLPNGAKLMVEDDPELLELAVRLRTLGLLPQSHAGAGQKAW